MFSGAVSIGVRHLELVSIYLQTSFCTNFGFFLNLIFLILFGSKLEEHLAPLQYADENPGKKWNLEAKD